MASLMGILKSWQNYDRHLHIIYIHIHIYSNGCNQWMNQWLDSRTKTRHNFFTWKFQGFLSLVVLIFIPRIASGWVSDFPIDHFFRWWCLLTISIFFDSVKPQLFMGKFPFFPVNFPICWCWIQQETVPISRHPATFHPDWVEEKVSSATPNRFELQTRICCRLFHKPKHWQ